MDKRTDTGYVHVQPTAEQITKHLKGGTGQVIVYKHGSQWRITAVRVVGNRKKTMQGRIFGFERFTEENQWTDIPSDARIDLR